jgi:ABC-type lipoprotein release transport system permease subunit
MSQWLSLYTFKVELSFWIFLLELGFVMLVVVLTTGLRSLRAAWMNPVNALRAE